MNVVPIRFHNTSMNRELGTLQNGSSGFWGHLWSGNSVAKALKTASILWQTLSSHTSANNHITVIPKHKTSWKWKKCIPKDIPKNCQNSVSFTSLYTPCIPGNMTFYIPMTQRDNLSCTKIHFNFFCCNNWALLFIPHICPYRYTIFRPQKYTNKCANSQQQKRPKRLKFCVLYANK